MVTDVIKKTIGYELLGLDINGQWYDSIKNGGEKIKSPKLFMKKKNIKYDNTFKSNRRPPKVG